MPGLNELLAPFGAAYSSRVWKGPINIGPHSPVSPVPFPPRPLCLALCLARDSSPPPLVEGKQMLHSAASRKPPSPLALS